MRDKLRFFLGLFFAIGLLAGTQIAPNAANAQDATLASQNDGGTGTGVFEDDRILGDLDAPVTIVEYSSMTCPHCAAFHNGAYDDVVKEYIDTGKARLIYRDLPWNGLAFRAALVSRCLPEKRYFPFVKRIFSTQAEWTKQEEAGLIQLASLAGVNAVKYRECIEDKAEQEKILLRRQQALEELKVSGTPYFFINGEAVNGARSIDAFRKVIDRALSDAGVE